MKTNKRNIQIKSSKNQMPYINLESPYIKEKVAHLDNIIKNLKHPLSTTLGKSIEK